MNVNGAIHKALMGFIVAIVFISFIKPNPQIAGLITFAAVVVPFSTGLMSTP